MLFAPLSHPNGPNLEQLASMDPDLVFSSRTWAKGHQAMTNLGIDDVPTRSTGRKYAYMEGNRPINVVVGDDRGRDGDRAFVPQRPADAVVAEKDQKVKEVELKPNEK